MYVASCGWNPLQVGVSRQLGGATMPWSPGRAACPEGLEAINGVSRILFMFSLMK